MLNETLKNIHEDINNYFYENKFITLRGKTLNFVLDIEACPTENKNEVLTYSVAIMSCDNDNNICYKFNNVKDFLRMIINAKCENINFYIHNLLYDIKPFLIEFVNTYNATQNIPKIADTEEFNIFEGKKESLKVEFKDYEEKKKKLTYDVCLKKGQLYNVTFYGKDVKKVDKNRRVTYEPIKLSFFDTFKIFPYSLQKSCKAFLNLELGKDGLDYNKIRNIDDELTKEEKIYIYNDVFGLSYLVKKMIINGFEINGKLVKYTKLTNSSQSLYDYKNTLLEDYEKRQNCFGDDDLFYYANNIEFENNKFLNGDNDTKQEILFKKMFPPQNYFIDKWIRSSYYGGLCTPHYKNIKKFSKEKNKIGCVYDVNSLYPFIMKSRLLPFGKGEINEKSYNKMNEDYKKRYPLYIQEITIYDMKIKRNKMPFVQVKNNLDFNGTEILETNINKQGKKQPITLRLCSPLFKLLFENYNIHSYKLGGHIAFRGHEQFFENYLNYWGEIKKKETGANREIAKLRQNSLYGKFGTSGDTLIPYIKTEGGIFKVETDKELIVSDNIYIPMATFITSYAKEYLVKAINENYSNFLYCDTDSLHLFGNEVKGLKIDSKIYGCWDNELVFNDFKYLGPKRYAEKNIENNKWIIKCCGLTDKIMKNIDDITTFETCKLTSKELKNMKFYTSKDENNVYYYYDKELTKKVNGIYRSKKSKIVKNGTLISDQPYMITENIYL